MICGRRPGAGRCRLTPVLLLMASPCAIPAGASSQVPGTILTVAGGGLKGIGDGGPAADARLSTPRYLAVDRTGDLFISDEGMGRIRRVAPDGTITTYAGLGGVGDAGDGGPATQALMESPNGIALDDQGDLFIADTGNHRVKRVDSAGIITTVAGDGDGGYSGDGGPATGATLLSPQGVAVGPGGALYISDTGNRRIRRVGPDGIITTIAGNGYGGYSGDGGPATEARLAEPHGLAVDPSGTLYIADWGAHRVRKVSPDGTITTVAGNGMELSSGDGGTAVMASLREPGDIAIDSAGGIYIADENGGRVRKVAPDGTITTIAGTGEKSGSTGDGGPAAEAGVSWPTGLAIDAAGDLFIADSCYSRVREVIAGAAPGTFGVGVPTPARGDVNGDGRVDVADAIAAMASIVQGRSLAAVDVARADMNGDGGIDVRDVILILKLALSAPQAGL